MIHFTESNVVKALAASLRFDWMALYRPHNLDAFQYLVDGFKRSQLIRISPYKAETADTTGWLGSISINSKQPQSSAGSSYSGIPV